jgi:hypothetical protein
MIKNVVIILLVAITVALFISLREARRGDLNLDGKINGTDLSIFSSNWNK